MIILAALTFVLAGYNPGDDPPPLPDEKLPRCFIGEVHLQGVEKDYCIQPIDADRERLMNTPVVDYDHKPLVPTFSVQGTLGGGASIHTCQEWMLARSQGFSPHTSRDDAAADFFARTCGALGALLTARGANTSFIAGDGAELIKTEFVPAEVLAIAPFAPPASRSYGFSIADLRERDGVLIMDHKIAPIELKYGESYFSVKDVGRADVNRDGLEDLIVVVVADDPKTDTHVARVAYLTRRSATGDFEVVRPVND